MLKTVLISALNCLGIPIAFFLCLRTTPKHIFYEYSRLVTSIKLYKSVPFFWDILFFFAFTLSLFSLFESVKDLGGLVPTVRLFLDVKSHWISRVQGALLGILNALFCAVLWSFIKYYTAQRDAAHDTVLRHQEVTDYNYLYTNCLKIK